MFLLIFDSKICGRSDSADNLPEGWAAIEYDGTLPPESLELVDGEIREKQPPEPVPFAMPDSIGPNWDALLSGLEETPMWARVFGAAERTIKANAAFTLLLNTLTITRKAPTLAFAIAKMREALQGIEKIGDFDETEIASLNELLETTGFDLKLE